MPEPKETLRDLKQIVANGHVAMFLLKKTRSKYPEKKREQLKVELEDDAATFFKNTLLDKIDSLIDSNDSVFIDFSFGTESPQEILILDKISSIPTFTPIKESFERHEELDTVTAFDPAIVRNLKAIAVELSTDEKHKVTYFRKFTPGKVLFANTFTFLFRRGTFNRLRDDVFQFDNEIDCFYYELEQQKQMFILSQLNFENVFEFHRYYEEKATEVYQSLVNTKQVIFSEELLEEVKDSRSLCKKFVKLHQQGLFEKLNLHNFKIYLDKAHGRLSFSINSDKILITTAESLSDFLEVCEKLIVQDVIDPDTLYRVPRIKEL